MDHLKTELLFKKIYFISNTFHQIKPIISKFVQNFEWSLIKDKEDLRNEYNSFSKETLIISYNTSIIIPKEILDIAGLCINIHAAPPEYPGRDPHHWAIYDGAKRYGATAHIMTEKVDSGPIIDIEEFDVPTDCSPLELRDLSFKASIEILNRLIFKLLRNENINSLNRNWSKNKRTRKMFHEICEIKINIDKEELERRIHAFHVPTYKNIFVNLHGKKFFLGD